MLTQMDDIKKNNKILLSVAIVHVMYDKNPYRNLRGSSLLNYELFRKVMDCVYSFL